MSDRIPMGRMHIDDRMRTEAARVLDSGHWIKGPESKAFGDEWAAFCGALGGTPCSNGSTALIAALHALGVGDGDEVIVPSFTYIASATCITLVGATPVFVEVEEDYYTIDAEAARAAITPATKAIIAVHLYGQPISLDVFRIAREAGIPVIEDAAQAHGASLGGRRCGSFAELATFSFFPSKNMAVGGDGGAILANDADLLERARTFIDHGRSTKYRNDVLGTNFRLSEIQCAIGRAQLIQLDAWIQRRNEIANRYTDAFQDLPFILPTVREDAVHAWHQYVMRTEDRERFITHMDDSGISTGIHYPIPCHLQPVYAAHPQASDPALALTEIISDQVVSIPVFPLLEDAEVDRIVEAVRAWQT